MNAARSIGVVVFDFDGTLVDSLSFVLAAIQHAVEPFGGRPTMDIFANLGGPPERFLADLVPDQKHVPVAVQRLEAFHRENARMIAPYAGAVDLLEGLQVMGVRIGLWTGRDRVSTQWLMRQNKLTAYFSAAVCGDDLPSHKPDPAGLREILRQLGVHAADTLLVGDADVDVLGAAACGVEAILIQHARNAEPDIAAKAWRTVATPREAFDLVRTRLGKIS